MSYYTFYNFHTMPSRTKINVEYFIEELRKTCEDSKYAFTDEGISENGLIWNNHEKDLREFSVKYPNVVFVLSGTGEETLDVWHKYFKNGKMQYCPLIAHFDEYNEMELK